MSDGSAGSGQSRRQRVFESKVRLRDAPDQIKEIRAEASSKEEAVQQLIAQGFLVITVRETAGEEKVHWRDSLFAFRGRPKPEGKTAKSFLAGLEKVTTRDLIFFAIQLSTLLKAGIPLIRSLEIIRKGTKNARLYATIQDIVKRISGGTSLTLAIKRYPGIFPWVWINLVEVGESTGRLPQCLEEVSRYQEFAARMKAKVITAFFYPGILVCAVVSALTFLLVFIVPKFEEIFKAQKMTLPVITQIVIQASSVIRNQAWVLLLLFVPGIVLIFLIKRFPMARVRFDLFCLSAPIFGSLMLQVSAVRFARGVSTLLKSGVPVLEALEIGGRLTENTYLIQQIKKVAKAVKGGQGLGVQLEVNKVFPVFMTQLISVGEETGQIDKFLDIISVFYEERVDAFLQRLSTAIEPLLLVFMGIIIGTVVISMFLPIVELSTSANFG